MEFYKSNSICPEPAFEENLENDNDVVTCQKDVIVRFLLISSYILYQSLSTSFTRKALHCKIQSDFEKFRTSLQQTPRYMAYRVIELCKFFVRFVFQNGFRLLYVSRAKFCLAFISSVKLWVILRFQCITVGYIFEQNKIKAKR